MPAEDNENLDAVRMEIARLEQDLALEGSTRARLHAMNLRLLEMDDLVRDADALVLEPDKGGILGRLIDSLKALVQQWRSVKRPRRQEMAGLERAEQDGEP